MNLPASIEVEKLNQKHPDYVAFCKAWEEIDLLYKDGALLKAAASQFLKMKPREPGDVYRARLSRFTSEPILGPALGWYQAAMFANDPQISVLRDNETVKDNPYYTEFFNDCDDAGKKFVDFARDIFPSMLKFKSSYVLVDRDAIDAEYPSLAAQQQAGALDVHLVRYEPSQVINWETDDQGNLIWILIYTTDCEREFPGVEKVYDKWYYFDLTQCALYQALRDENGTQAKQALLEQGYPRPHALSGVKRVPVRWLTLPDGLWLGNRALLPASSHLDLVNALDWGIFNGCLPLLWIKGDYKDDVTKSEVSWIALEADGEVGYLEPSGTTFKLAADQISTKREEMYRQCYLQSLARSTKATAAAQSGYSKEMDMAPGKDVLNGMGDCLRTGLTNILMDVADARGEKNLTFTVKGFTFDDDDQDFVNNKQELLAIRLGETAEREIKKDIATVALKDSDQEVLDQVFAEIDAMPTDDQAAQEQLQARISASFGSPPPVGLPAK